jgi:hypothetical protein
MTESEPSLLIGVMLEEIIGYELNGVGWSIYLCVIKMMG